MVLSFDQSGAPAEFALADVRQLAAASGFLRPDGQTGDVESFFRHFGVKALTPFKALWATTKLAPPLATGPGTGTGGDKATTGETAAPPTGSGMTKVSGGTRQASERLGG